MPDVSAKIKGLNVEFNDNLTTSPNIDSGDDIKTSFARIHKRFSDMKTGAYEDIADQYYPSGDGSEKLVTGEIVQSAIESVSGDIEYIEYAIKNLSKEIYNNVEMPITTGYYISGITEGDDWTQHMDADSSSQYLENAFYLGARQINKKLKFTVADHRYTSGRCFGFCDENNIVTSYYKENWDIWEQNTDGTYTATLPISGPYFFLSYSDNEIIGFEISEELINQTGYVSPNGSDSNGGSSFDFAFKTVNKALSEGCTRIILDGGAYYQQIDLSPAHGKHIDIISFDREYKPVFYDPNCILAENATLLDGVYSTTIDQTISSGNGWLYQEGVPDTETQIADSERLPVQRGKTYRLDDTRIEKCYADNLTDALAEIKSSSIYKWYLDSNTLYFTAPTQPSQTNPICFSPGNDLFSGADRSISIRLSGIKCKYMSLNLKNLCNAEAIDCCSTNVFGWGAITWDNTLNAYFLRCEASSCRNDTNGDGFNADTTNTGEAFAKHYTSTLIDCWSHDSTDDGYSDHRHAESTIIGGLFEYNGKAGLTPSEGSHCSCYNVYSRKNYTGFMCVGDVEEAEGGKYTQMICYNCVAELNNRAGNETGFYVDGLNNRMTLISCKAIGNPTAYYVGQTASIKLVDCTSFDNNRFIHGYPENATIENTGLYRYLQQYSDLNDFTGNNNVGSYLCPNSRVSTITNKPESITTAFKMDVTFYNDQTMQMIYPNDNSCMFYVRIYNNSSWSDWIKSSNEINTTSPITKSYSGQDITIGHATSGVTAGTYKSVTVNETGHITSGSNPSTISGYGITDAKIQNGTITLGSNTITPITSFSSLDSPLVGGSGKYISSISETDGIISATEKTLDTVPTENSTNAITSGAVYTDSANQQLEINYAINTGAKNLFKIREPFTNTRNNVTFVVNVDGTVDVSTTSEGASAQTDLTIGTVNTYEGVTYKLTGCPSGVTGRCACGTGGTGSVIDTGSGALLTPTADSSRSPFVRVYNGAVITTPVKFYPMIRLAEIKNDTFEPYAPTNRELYETKTEQIETNVIANLGAKNMLYISNDPGYTATSHGRTFTVLSDGGIKITGASSDSSNADFYIIGSLGNRSILLNENRDSCLMRMKCDTDYGYNQIRLRAMNRSTGSTVNETGVETNKDVQLSHVITTVFVSVFPSVTLPEDGIVIYPMIRRAVITDDTYVPYAKTNRELTVVGDEDRAALIDQVDGGAKNLVNLNTSFTTQTHKGITYTNNGDGTINVAGTSNAVDSYVTLYDRNENNLFGVPIGETVVIKSTSNTVSINLIYKKQGGGYGLTVYGYKDTPATFTVPTDFVGFLLRIGVLNNGTTVNENVGAILCTATDYAISPEYVPYAPTNRELYETKLTANDVWGYGQLIPDSADLNNYTTGGKYYGGNSAGSTVLNLPVANGSFTFTLEVKLATPSMTYQYLRVCRLADDPYIYCRRKYNSWGSWYRFTGETVVVSASTQSLNSQMTLNLGRNDLDETLDTDIESLDTDIESIDSIPEEESESYNIDEELTKDESE